MTAPGGGGLVVAEARVRLRPIAGPNFASELNSQIGPSLDAAEARITGTGSRVHGALMGVSRNLGGFGVPFVGALDVIDRRLLSTGNTADTFGKKLSNIGAGELLVAGAALAFLGKRAIDAGSDLTESLSASGVVFARNREEVEDWAGGLTGSFGISKQEALEAASGFGFLLVSMGENADKAQEMSQRFVELAGDISSFRNVRGEDVLIGLRSALVGEFEPMRRYGSALSAVRIEEEALRHGIRAKYNEMSTAQKAETAYALIMRDTVLAQGDYERTSGQLANRQRTLAAEWENAQAALGMKVIPGLLGAADAALVGAHGFQAIDRASEGAVGKILLVGAAIPVAAFAVDKLGDAGKWVVDSYSKVGDKLHLTGTAAEALAATEATSSGTRVAANAALIGSEAAVTAAEQSTAAAALAKIAADQAVVEAQFEVSGSAQFEAGALDRLTAAKARATAAGEVLVAAERAEAAARAQAAATAAAQAGAQLGVGPGAATTGVGVAGLTSMLGPAAIAAGALAFGIYQIKRAAADDAAIRELTRDLQGTAAASEEARDRLNEVISPHAGDELRRYSDLLLSGADANKLNAAASEMNSDAMRDAVREAGFSAGIWQKSDEELKTWLGGQPALRTEINLTQAKLADAREELEKLTEKYGPAAIQNAQLSAAQKRYGDLLAEGGHNERELASARAAVTGAAGRAAAVQHQVNTATEAGVASSTKYRQAVDALRADIQSGHVTRDQLGKDWQAVEQHATGAASTQAELEQILYSVGLAAVSAAGGVISLSMAEAALGNFSANAVESGQNLTQAASAQDDANWAAKSSTLAYNEALHGLSDAQDGSGSGGGAAGSTKTAIAAMIEQEQKALSLRDALKAAADVERQIAEDREAIADARSDLADATKNEAREEREYAVVLHGVSAASKLAQDAQENLTLSRLDARSSVLDLREAERALDEARQTERDHAAENAQAIADAEAQLADARSTGDAVYIADAEKTLQDVRTEARKQAAEDKDATERADIALRRSKLSVKDANEKLDESERVYHGTLHGFSATSQEAQDAYDELTQAKEDTESATDALDAAERQLRNTQDQVATTAVAVMRAQADVRGELDSLSGSGGSAAKAVKAYGDLETKMGSVRETGKRMADDIRDAVTQSTGSTVAGLQAYVAMLQRIMDTTPMLKGAFDATIRNVNLEIEALVAQKTGEMGSGAYVPGHGPNRNINAKRSARGGRVLAGEYSTVGEEGTEWIHAVPGGGVQVWSHGSNPEGLDNVLAFTPRAAPASAPTLQPSVQAGGGSVDVDGLAKAIAREVSAALREHRTFAINGDLIALDPDEMASKAERAVSRALRLS